MKIECILKRPGGTTAEIGGIDYTFEPLSDGAHVADVLNEAHIDRFLAIPDGYKVYHGKETPSGKPQVAKTANAPALPSDAHKAGKNLSGSTSHPPSFDVGGKSYTQLEIVQIAFFSSGLSYDEWNSLDEEERAAKIDIALDDLLESTEIEVTDDRDELIAQYEAKFGKKPHYRLSIEKIKAELQ